MENDLHVDTALINRMIPVGGRVIVAGAGSGVGRAVVMTLVRAGARVVAIDIAADSVQETRAAAIDPERVHAIAADVTDDEAVRRAIDTATSVLGGLDALVNCVGITGTTGVRSDEVDIADFDRVARVNLRAALVLSQAVLPHMLNGGYGRILHLASIAGKEGNAGMVSYSASKAGLIGMVKAMGKEYAGTGVTVNAVAPAVIRTPLVDAMPEHQVAYMTDKIPMGRTAELQEVADLVTFAISPATGFITGFTWDLTGGRATY